MKKPYQIDSRRTVGQFEAMAAEGNQAVQMVLPVAEMSDCLHGRVGELIRHPGVQRQLDKIELCALLIAATPFASRWWWRW